MLAMIWARRLRPLKISLSILLPIALLGLSGCKIFNADLGDGDGFGGGTDGEIREFDNATEAILAARSAPDSEQVLELEGKFKSGDYPDTLRSARELAASAEPASEEQDAALFMEGASLYYLGRHEQAQAPLDRHRREFPTSRYAESAQYYSGSNLVKQMRWRAGGQALGEFLNQFPESLLVEFALYDRATAHYALGEYDQCIAIATRIENEFLYSKIRDRAAILRGDVLRKRGELAQSEAAFLSAKNAAESAGHPKVAARALRNLIEVSAGQGRWADSVTYYETFFQKYTTSSQAPAAALAGIEALKEQGKLETGFDRLEEVLVAMPEGTNARSLNKALRTYAIYYRERHGPEELLKRLGNLSSSGRGSSTLREQLIVARLEVLEAYFPERTAEIRVFYDEIRYRFERSQLSTPTVLKIANYMAKTDLQGAAIWYRELLSRPGSQLKDEATLGLAQVLAASSNSQKLAEAASLFRKVLEAYGSPGLEEEAVLGMARVAVKREHWAGAKAFWKRYLSDPNWSLARDEAEQGLQVAGQKAPKSAPPVVVPSPTPTPAAPMRVPNAPEPAGGDPKVLQQLRQAERMVGSGMKAQAYEVLKSLLERGEAMPSPDPGTASALRRARILKENLQLELGVE